MNFDYYEDLCNFCENNLILLYICDDCNAVFCGDCLKETISSDLACQVCGSSDIGRDKSNKFKCNNCNSFSIVSVQKKISICPNCTGTNVVKISDKTNSLLEDFKQTVIGTRNWLTPLSEKTELISNRAYKLIGLREDLIKILHFPNLEIELLQVIKLFNNLKSSVEKKTIDFYEEINRNLKYFFNLSKLSPKTLPIVTAVAQSLQHNSNENYEYILQGIKRLDTRLTTINLKINFMDAIQSIFRNFQSIMQMDKGEKAVFGLKCKLDSGENKSSEFNSRNGTILLTNRRLYFFHEKGFRKKNRKTALLFTVNLNDLQNVNVEGVISKKLSLEFATGMYKFKINREKRSQLIDFIEKAKFFDSNKIDPESFDALKRVVITIKPLRDSLEDAIYTILNYENSFNDENQCMQELNESENIPFMDNQYSQYDTSINSITSNQPNNRNQPYPYLDKWFGNINHPQNSNGNINNNQNIQYANQNSNQPNLNRPGRGENNNPSFNHRNQTQTPPSPNYNGSVDYLYETYRKRPFPTREQMNPNYPTEMGYYSYQHSGNQYPPPPPPDIRNFNAPVYPQNTGYQQNFRNTNQHKGSYRPKNSPLSNQNQTQFYPNPSNYINSNGKDINSLGNQVFGEQNARFDPTPKNLNPLQNQYQTEPESHNPRNNLHENFEKIRKSTNKIDSNNNIDNYLKTVENFEGDMVNSNLMEDSMKIHTMSKELRGYNTNKQYQNQTHNRYTKEPKIHNSLMTIFPNEELKKPSIPKPKRLIPRINFSKINKPKNFAEELLKLEEQQFGLRRTIEMIALEQKNGKISEDAYLRKYQKLQQQLYRVQKQIEKINKYI